MDLHAATVKFNASAERGNALRESYHADSSSDALVDGWQARRVEGPILAEQRKPGQGSTQLGIKPRPGEPRSELAVPDGTDVDAVCVCEIALVVSLDLASEHQA